MEYKIKAIQVNGEELYAVTLNGVVKGTFDNLSHAMEYKHALEELHGQE